MAKPIIHARSSARRFGGVAEDYIGIHDLMDSSKAAFPDNRHRTLTHNSWFFFIVERIYGHEIELHDEDGNVLTRKASTRDVCEQHVLEDYGGKFIPTPADYLEGMEYQPWMNNAISGAPTSHRKLQRHSTKTRKRAVNLD